MEKLITISIIDGVADVRLDRPEKLNALSTQMFSDLLDAGEALRQDASLRAVVVSGNGKAFCAGLDMQSFERMRAGNGLESAGAGPLACGLLPRTFGIANAYQQVAMMWREIPVPVIAAVHGVALGGGFQVALGADMRFVAPDARMAALEIQWGLVPDMAGILLMRELARPDVVRDLTFSGRQFSGAEALQLGFATQVHADPLAAALDYAAALAGRSVDALKAGKRLHNLASSADAAAILAAESHEQQLLMGSPGQLAAIDAAMRHRRGA